MSMKFRSDDKFCFHRSCNTFLGKVILICRCQLNVKATGTLLARTRNERSNILIDLLLWLATGPFSVVGSLVFRRDVVCFLRKYCFFFVSRQFIQFVKQHSNIGNKIIDSVRIHACVWFKCAQVNLIGLQIWPISMKYHNSHAQSIHFFFTGRGHHPSVASPDRERKREIERQATRNYS